ARSSAQFSCDPGDDPAFQLHSVSPNTNQVKCEEQQKGGSMSSSKDAAAELTLSEKELERVRSDREGLEWLHDFLASENDLETVQPGGAPSATPISEQAFDLIVEFEVSTEQTYTQKYRRPVWPKGQSGATIGIGYDVGYASNPQLWADWDGAIPDKMIEAL